MRDPAHWAFELFLMVLFDGLVAGLLWPIIRKHCQKHHPQDWSMNPIAVAAGHIADDCVKCDGERVLLDTSVVMCKTCGHVSCPPKDGSQ